MDNLSFKLNESNKYVSCCKTLKQTSHDKENNQYLCRSEQKVYDFDCMTRIIYPEKTPSSSDALVIMQTNNECFLYCIEFKNQSASDIKKEKLREKLKQSQETLKQLFNDNSVSKADYHFLFCVVYKDSPPSNYGKYKPHFSKTTDKFDLETHMGNIFKTNKV